MPKTAYHLVHPATRDTAVIFASPHSGRDYGGSFMRKTILDAQTIRSSEDAYVDRLFETATDHGAVFLKAGAPRAFVDLNRGRDELDPALIKGVTKTGLTPRVASGLGVIPRVVANGRAIYHGKIDLAEAVERLQTFWLPYHCTLRRLMAENHARFGQAILLDCHSMPHEAVTQQMRGQLGHPEIVIGDRFGASASAEIVDRVESIFASAGFNVARNTPFAGAYIVRQYGRPSQGHHAIQIEIDRSLYLDESRITPNRNFGVIKSVLQEVILQLAALGRSGQALAAE